MTQKQFKLTESPVHLGLGAKVIVQPAFTGDFSWYESYLSRHEGDGAEGRLVAMETYTDSWGAWEMHPNGDELVLCVAGRATLLQQANGETTRVELGPGDAVINAPGIWHTADVAPGESATLVFITAGLGTEHRPRE